MSDPFVAEIRAVPFNFAPRGWATCNGQLLPISQNTALFSLLGTTYGGDGKSNFALPNLQGCAPMHPGQGPGLSLHDLGEQGGESFVTLLETQMPAHTHGIKALVTPGTTASPAGASFAKGPGTSSLYGPASGTPSTLAPQALAPNGSNLPHNNMQPYLTLNFIIAMQGIYPPRT